MELSTKLKKTKTKTKNGRMQMKTKENSEKKEMMMMKKTKKTKKRMSVIKKDVRKKETAVKEISLSLGNVLKSVVHTVCPAKIINVCLYIHNNNNNNNNLPTQDWLGIRARSNPNAWTI